MMHQSRIWLTLKSILSGTFILLLIIMKSSSSVVPRKYWYIQRYYTWQDAQSYCRKLDNHTDLATIFTKSDADELDLKQYYAWVCWKKNYVTDRFSGPCYSDYSRACGAVHYNNDSVYGAGCADNFFFICGNPNELITQSKTLYDAYNYCSGKGGDLVTLSDDNQLKSVVGDQDFSIWIGLQRYGKVWNWSAGSSDYTNWAPNEPQNNKNCVSISSLSKNMTTQDCSSRFPFLCYRQDNLVLVQENKTWEEALEYCRALSPPTSYDLVSVQPEDYNYVMKRLVEANTEEVWTGLRFLDGEWLWVNGADMLYSDLPLCPTMLHRCGVLSINSTDSMEPRDCAERKYFMCYRK